MTSSFPVPLAPNNLARPPVFWSAAEVKAWVEFCVQEFSLAPIAYDKFDMNGKAMMLLNRSDFMERAPHAGDVLYNALTHLNRATVNGNITFNAPIKTPVIISTSRELGAQQDFLYSTTLTNHHPPPSPFIPILPHPSPHKTNHVIDANNGRPPSSRSDFGTSLDTVPGSILSPAATDKSFSDTESCLNYADSPVKASDSPSLERHHSNTPVVAANCSPEENEGHMESFMENSSLAEQKGECRLLWEFIYQLLSQDQSQELVCWESLDDLVFRINDPTGLAQQWGCQKNRSNMTYEKLSRALRYYYKMNIIHKVPGKKLTYKFLQSPDKIRKGQRGAKPHCFRSPPHSISSNACTNNSIKDDSVVRTNELASVPNRKLLEDSFVCPSSPSLSSSLLGNSPNEQETFHCTKPEATMTSESVLLNSNTLGHLSALSSTGDLSTLNCEYNSKECVHKEDIALKHHSSSSKSNKRKSKSSSFNSEEHTSNTIQSATGPETTDIDSENITQNDSVMQKKTLSDTEGKMDHRGVSDKLRLDALSNDNLKCVEEEAEGNVATSSASLSMQDPRSSSSSSIASCCNGSIQRFSRSSDRKINQVKSEDKPGTNQEVNIKTIETCAISNTTFEAASSSRDFLSPFLDDDNISCSVHRGQDMRRMQQQLHMYPQSQIQNFLFHNNHNIKSETLSSSKSDVLTASTTNCYDHNNSSSAFTMNLSKNENTINNNTVSIATHFPQVTYTFLNNNDLPSSFPALHHYHHHHHSKLSSLANLHHHHHPYNYHQIKPAHSHNHKHNDFYSTLKPTRNIQNFENKISHHSNYDNNNTSMNMEASCSLIESINSHNCSKNNTNNKEMNSLNEVTHTANRSLRSSSSSSSAFVANGHSEIMTSSKLKDINKMGDNSKKYIESKFDEQDEIEANTPPVTGDLPEDLSMKK